MSKEVISRVFLVAAVASLLYGCPGGGGDGKPIPVTIVNDETQELGSDEQAQSNVEENVQSNVEENAAPSITAPTISAPTIQGFVITGQTLSVSSYGTGSSADDSHQWYADGDSISGATGTTYTVEPSDEGKDITLRVNGSGDSNALSNWYPLDEPKVQAWYDSADISTITATSNSVSSWNNKASGSFDLSSFGGGGNPKTNTQNLNGLNILDWDTEGNYSLANVSEISIGDVFLICKYRNATFSSYDGLFSSSTHEGESGDGVFLTGNVSKKNLWTSSTNTEALFLNGSILGSAAGDVLPSLNDPSIISSQRTSTEVSVAGINIGSDRQHQIHGNRGWDGLIGDVIISDTIMTEAEREKVEGYLAHKYALTTNLPPTHPYKEVAP